MEGWAIRVPSFPHPNPGANPVQCSFWGRTGDMASGLGHRTGDSTAPGCQQSNPLMAPSMQPQSRWEHGGGRTKGFLQAHQCPVRHTPALWGLRRIATMTHCLAPPWCRDQWPGDPPQLPSEPGVAVKPHQLQAGLVGTPRAEHCKLRGLRAWAGSSSGAARDTVLSPVRSIRAGFTANQNGAHLPLAPIQSKPLPKDVLSFKHGQRATFHAQGHQVPIPCPWAPHPGVFPGWIAAMRHCRPSLGTPGKALRQLQKTLYANPHTHKASLCDSEFFLPSRGRGGCQACPEEGSCSQPRATGLSCSHVLPHSKGNQEVEEVFWGQILAVGTVQTGLSPHPVLGCLGLLFLLLGRIPKP